MGKGVFFGDFFSILSSFALCMVPRSQLAFPQVPAAGLVSPARVLVEIFCVARAQGCFFLCRGKDLSPLCLTLAYLRLKQNVECIVCISAFSCAHCRLFLSNLRLLPPSAHWKVHVPIST